MAETIKSGSDVIVMDVKDHVATALKDLAEGQTFYCRIQDEVKPFTAADPIPFGHKVAIEEIRSGQDVLKYGEVIGRATTDIQVGRHVHVHNLEGIRGRGDQAGK
ncbi:UxaA family hydrolase [Paenibacillus sp. CC-CFT747]|nr:UxaA family hydrolase [Paenibacillus sp. CC-CFT747]